MKYFSKVTRFVSIVTVLALATFLFLQRQAQLKLRDENQVLRDQIAELKAENQRLADISDKANSQVLSNEQFKELLRLRGEVSKFRAQQKATPQKATPKPQEVSDNQPPSIEAPPSETVPDGAIPRDSWQFVGYATPESALQSAMWAMNKGDIQAFLNSLTPEGYAAVAKQFENKSEAEVATLINQQIGKIKALRLDRKKVSPEGDVSFGVWSEEQDDGATRFKSEAVLQFRNVGGEWKFTGF